MNDLKSNMMVFDCVSAFSDEEVVRTAPSEILIIKYGTTTYSKNNEKGTYEFAEEDADKIINDFNEKKRDIVIDYEHKSLSGDPAPAAGWINGLQKTAEGLVCQIKYWTDEAKKFIESGSYRYWSPTLYMSRRRPLSLHSLSLTNNPATYGLSALVASDNNNEGALNISIDQVSSSSISDDSEKRTIVSSDTTNLNKEKDIMDIKKLAEVAGIELALSDKNEMDEVKTFDSIVAKIESLKSIDSEKQEFLKLHEVADFGAMTLKVKGMVPAAELESINKKLAKIEAEKAVAKAFSDKKLVEAQRQWATEYAESNLKGFSDFIASAPAIAPAPASEIKVAEVVEEKVELNDAGFEKEYEKDEKIRAEFSDKKSYIAFRRSEVAGNIKILKK